MSVVVTGAKAADLPALTTFAAFGPLTVAIAPTETAADLGAALRALGHEVLVEATDLGAAAREPGGVPAALEGAVRRLPMALGFALGPLPPGALREAVLASAVRAGALLLDTVPAATSALAAEARRLDLPAGGAVLAVRGDADATRAFQLLREAGARAVREGSTIVVLDAAPATLTALGRWLALPGTVTPAPLSITAARQGG